MAKKNQDQDVDKNEEASNVVQGEDAVVEDRFEEAYGPKIVPQDEMSPERNDERPFDPLNHDDRSANRQTREDQA